MVAQQLPSSNTRSHEHRPHRFGLAERPWNVDQPRARQRTSDLTSEEVKLEDAEARKSDETRPTSVDESDTVAL